jgi:hypothetical protein
VKGLHELAGKAKRSCMGFLLLLSTLQGLTGKPQQVKIFVRLPAGHNRLLNKTESDCSLSRGSGLSTSVGSIADLFVCTTIATGCRAAACLEALLNAAFAQVCACPVT